MKSITPETMRDSDFEKFTTGLAEAFQYIKYSRDEVAFIMYPIRWTRQEEGIS